MAAKAFTTYFETQAANGDKINLKLFLKQFFAQITPPKTTLNYNLPIEILIKGAQECTLYNFCSNPFFKEYLVDIQDYKQMYDLFTRTHSFGENEIAQTLFLLHFSKSKIETLLFLSIMKDIGSIQIAQNLNKYSFYNSLCEIYKNVLKNQHLQQNLQQVINSLIGSESNYNFEETRVVYFITSLKGLHGFAGINTIYINIEMFSKIYNFPNYSHNEKLTILKMNFVRIISHEITHVAIRFKKNDFNMSSPVEKKNKPATNYDPSVSYEAGALVEEKVFNGRIDWALSVENNVSVDYCEEFLLKLFNDQCPEFNIAESRAVLRRGPIVTMAIDFDFYYYSFVFE